jgi:hypothetical protein
MFEYFRNEDLNANDWFTKSFGESRGILRQNQYGFTAEGPLVKNKLLLFGSWQGTRQYNETDPFNHKVDYEPPITDNRSAAGLGAVFGGQQGWLGAFGGTVLANGSNIAPQALALLNTKLTNGQYMIPSASSVNPSAPGGFDSEGTAFVRSPGFFNENQWMANGDYLLSDRNKIAVRYFGALSDQEYTRLKGIHSISQSASTCLRSQKPSP